MSWYIRWIPDFMKFKNDLNQVWSTIGLSLTRVKLELPFECLQQFFITNTFLGFKIYTYTWTKTSLTKKTLVPRLWRTLRKNLLQNILRLFKFLNLTQISPWLNYPECESSQGIQQATSYSTTLLQGILIIPSDWRILVQREAHLKW